MSRRKGRLSTLVLIGGVVLAVCGVAAEAKLPRTYIAQKVDSPAPTVGGDFGIAFVNGGDLNADGKDDLIVGTDEHGGSTGTIFEISGADGSAIRAIPSPDPDGASTKASFGSYVGSIADMGSCPGGMSGVLCPHNSIGPGDGVPDVLVTALGVDVPGTSSTLVDAGRAYLYDGATGALLKRIDMPTVDIDEQITAGNKKPAFGRTILSPSSPYGSTGGGPLPTAVKIGDMNGGGAPDIIVDASDYYETGTTSNTQSTCHSNPSNQCLQAGRAYIYYGESIVATDPAVIENTPNMTIRNPDAQPDDLTSPVNANRENLGYSIEPVGDLGKCTSGGLPGLQCADHVDNAAGDNLPDVVISSHRSDDFGMFDAGMAPLFDGATGALLYNYRHPEPQPASLFGFSNYNQPAPGDLGATSTPDIYQAAMRQNNPNTGGGKGYVMNGAFRQSGSPNSVSFATFVDPTPNASEDFGTSSAGVGNVVGAADGLDSRNEMLIGAYGPHNPGTNPFVINDVHFFSALTEHSLMDIKAPDQQEGLGFGNAVAPLGDLNGDGILDLAVGAGLYDGTTGADQGRIYIFRSDDSPAPPAEPSPTGSAGPVGPQGPPGTPAVTLAGREVDLVANHGKVRRGKKVTLRGVLQAFANPAGCERGQTVQIQRRTPTSPRYVTVATKKTDSSGGFSGRFTVTRTRIYRARVAQTDSCLGAVSSGERVRAVKTKAAR